MQQLNRPGRASPLQSDIQLILELANPPVAPVSMFGLQDSRQNLHPGTPQADGSLLFACVISVREKAGALDFGGPFVHGTPAERFLYLSLRGTTSNWVQRMKITLNTITPQHLAAGSPVTLRIRLEQLETRPRPMPAWQVV